MDARELVALARRGGLRGASVEVEVRGQPVAVTDQHFDLVHAEQFPKEPLELARSVQAAAIVASLRPDQVQTTRQRAHAGNDKAMRAYAAWTLHKLCEVRREARDLMGRALAGDPAAKAAVVARFQHALGARDEREKRRATLFALLMRDALAEARAPRPQPRPAQDQPAPGASAEAGQAGQAAGVGSPPTPPAPSADPLSAEPVATELVFGPDGMPSMRPRQGAGGSVGGQEATT